MPDYTNQFPLNQPHPFLHVSLTVAATVKSSPWKHQPVMKFNNSNYC